MYNEKYRTLYAYLEKLKKPYALDPHFLPVPLVFLAVADLKYKFVFIQSKLYLMI